MIQRKVEKFQNTVEYGISKVKELADGRFWATNHSGCFRATFGKGETPAHRDKNTIDGVIIEILEDVCSVN